jgi:dTDP-4-dehydrorhamnose 3,5-epimerase
MFGKPYSQSDFAKLGISFSPVEHFYSLSRRHVLRGMHFQREPASMSKLVWCTRGKVLDVVVDIRTDSPWFNRPFTCELTEHEPVGIFIPQGYAHGFLSLEDDSATHYLVSVGHDPGLDVGVLWSSINFDWPIANPVLSERDLRLPSI